MARQILLTETRKASDGITQVNGFFWYPIAAANAQVPRPGFVSAGIGFTGAALITPAEQASLEDGSVREESFGRVYPASTTNAQIKADLQKYFTDRSAAVALEPPTRQYFGVSFNGTVWSA